MDKIKEVAKKVVKAYGREMKEAFQDGVEAWKNTPEIDMEDWRTVWTRQKPLNALFGFLWPKKRSKKTGLKSILEQGKRVGKRALAIGSTMAVLSGVGHGINGIRHTSERNELKENVEYFVQNNNQTLAFSEDSPVWNINSQIDIFKLDKQQLKQYNQFMSDSVKCLFDLTNDIEDNLKGRISGKLDPAKRFNLIYKNLSEQIVQTEKNIVSSRGAPEHIVKRQILQKVFNNMQQVEKKINQGKTQSERLEIAEKLHEMVSARQGRSYSLGCGTVSRDQLRKEQTEDFSKNSNVLLDRNQGR